MARRRDPERIYSAKRAGLMARLEHAHHLSEERAEAVMASWEAEASKRGLVHEMPAYWSQADDWIADHLT